MRKWLCLVCALCLLAGLMAPALGEEADFYAGLLRQVEALSALNGEAAELCDGALSELYAFIETYSAALDSMGTYDLDGYRDGLAARGARMDDCAERLRTIQEGLWLMTAADAKQQSALQACRDYADEALAALNAARRTNAFQQAQYAASAPLDALTEESAAGETQFATARRWETASQEVYYAFCELTPPDYARSAWRSYLEQVWLFAQMCQKQREGIGYGDVMQLYSASQLLVREYTVMAKYEFALFDLHFLSYARSRERLAFLRENLEGALRSACAGEEVSFEYRDRQPRLTMDYELIDSVYPNLYQTLDCVVNLNVYADWGERDILVTAQIVGFSQEYRQKLTVNTELTRLTIKPPVLAEAPSLFNTRDTQLVFSITDAATGELLVQESKTLKLHSLYDYDNYDNEFGTVLYYEFLSWLTPESEGVLKVRREAIRWLEENTEMSTLAGYQNVLGLSDDEAYMNTYYQAIGLQAAISSLGVRYNWGAFSLNSFQRILMPDAVVDSQSGICIETSILLASALKSAMMHPMILLTPGHARVILETWRDSHEYFLLETTQLPFTGSQEDIDAYITYMTQEQWTQFLQYYIEQGQAYVVDCDLLESFGYQAMY